jgi:gamma-glutamylputrescine oxidase
VPANAHRKFTHNSYQMLRCAHLMRSAKNNPAMDQPNPTSAHGGSWYAATRIDAPQRPQLTSDCDVDVCVIGGGLAGLTTAHEVARAGWSVVLLEAGHIAGEASGRNTGFVLPGFAASPDSIISRVGFDRAKDLWALAQSGLDYVRDVIRHEAMPGIDPQDGWLYVSKTDNGDELTRLAALVGEFGGEIEGWPTDKVRAVLRSERYFHAIHYPRAINIHPLNYAFGLAAAAERFGARIYENTPVISLDPAGVRKRIVTPQARLRSSHVVLCGNLQIAGLMPRIGATLIPITTYVITTASLGPVLSEAVGYHGSVSDTDLADNHYRIVGGDRLMWSGRLTMWTGNPRRYVRALAADIGRTYPQLGKVAVDYVWSGTVGHSIHGMPQIGELGPGVWLASGFGGHGLNTTAMAGNLVARAIVDGDATWKQFTPFELVWAGGKFGRAAAQIYYWTRRLRDASAERRGHAANGTTMPLHARLRQMIKSEEPEGASQQSAPANEDVDTFVAPAADAEVSVTRFEGPAEQIEAPTATVEAPTGDDGPPPMIAVASRRESVDGPEDSSA